MNGNRSVATIDAPEFINLQPYNPLISQCEIKVLYLGKNRNGSFIDKNTAIQMANSLPGCPIVGAYREEIEDFGDHGHIMHIEDGEIKFSCKTRPYGFVAPDAQVWFKKFTDTDDFGEETEREYLMTTGYLWTGQYEEVADVVSAGKGQSMELDEKTLNGKWSEDSKSGMSFFIINDAVFSKLCILGDDVEPCFEGASITQPDVSKDFAVDPDFSRTLFTMMNELKDALQDEGGSRMNEDQLNQAEEVIDDPDTSTEEFVDESTQTDEVVDSNFDADDGADAEDDSAEDEATDDAAEEEEEATDEADEEDSEPASANILGAGIPMVVSTAASDKDDDEDDDEENDEDDRKKRTQMTLVDPEELDNLRAEVAELRQFKANVESSEKDALIRKYYMLSDEDKANITEHKDEYSLDELDAKLAQLYVQKNVNFELEEEDEIEDSLLGALTFNLDEEDANGQSGILMALRETVHE